MSGLVNLSYNCERMVFIETFQNFFVNVQSKKYALASTFGGKSWLLTKLKSYSVYCWHAWMKSVLCHFRHRLFTSVFACSVHSTFRSAGWSTPFCISKLLRKRESKYSKMTCLIRLVFFQLCNFASYSIDARPDSNYFRNINFWNHIFLFFKSSLHSRMLMIVIGNLREKILNNKSAVVGSIFL